MSGRDIRRVVARASVFPNAEKASMVLRLIAAAGTLGVERVLVSTDTVGVAAGVLRAYRRERNQRATRWPDVEFVELERHAGTAADTAEHIRRMRVAGAGLIVLLGGDGTVRAAAPVLGDTPVLPLSTGTNNAFPQVWEATVAGTAAALVVTGRLDADTTTDRAKVLTVRAGDTSELALVDVCISTLAHVGARALWQVDSLREIYCAFAEPHAIGLSSVAGQLLPTSRTSDDGVAIRLGEPGDVAARTVLAPVAPGVLHELQVADVRPLAAGDVVGTAVGSGTVAVDGEREIEFGPATAVTVELGTDGPRVLDVRRALQLAAAEQLLTATSRTAGEVH
ncbi:MAG: ATP-NAD kinase [Pseudonocardiaceae bacterium]|nr:ATP-NAD kinase [Pseudonocardiaceae bacterium]